MEYKSEAIEEINYWLNQLEKTKIRAKKGFLRNEIVMKLAETEFTAIMNSLEHYIKGETK